MAKSIKDIPGGELLRDPRTLGSMEVLTMALSLAESKSQAKDLLGVLNSLAEDGAKWEEFCSKPGHAKDLLGLLEYLGDFLGKELK